MPYAVPSPGSSPTSTMTLAPLPVSPVKAPPPAPPPIHRPVSSLASISPRSTDTRPLRHHQRSHSSEPVASTSSLIFVQPASPEDERGLQRSYLWSSPSGSSPTPMSGYATIPRQQRKIRMSALTPAGPFGSSISPSSSGPSSQEDWSEGLRGRKEGRAASFAEEDRPPRAGDSIFANAFPFGPSSSSTSPSPTPSEDGFTGKPALMVRKKSGELVRPSLKADTMRRDFSKPRSAPATPTCPKYVHFDTQLEHVKHFLAQQRPAAVSRSGSPIETETEEEPEAFPFPAMATAQAGTVKLVLPNFPPPSIRAAASAEAYVESLEMTSDGKNIRGIVRVQNLSFEKWVAVRFTLDNWQTVSEVSGEHHESLPGGKEDRFAFTIKLQDLLARIEEKTMFLAVRYTVGGREIWDNNDNQNYRIEFRKVPTPPSGGHRSAASMANAAASRAAAQSAAERRKNAWSVTNAGQAADRMADLRRELDRLVRDEGFDDDETDQSSASLGLSSSSQARLGIGGAAKRFGPDARSYSEGAPSLSGRYDFGNSLKMYTDKGNGMKERPAGSPSLVVPSPLATSSISFFDPVSTSPQRPRAPPLPPLANPADESKPFATTTLIHGMPATVYDPSLTAPSLINSHRGGGESPLLSPRPPLRPDFGLPSTSAARASATAASGSAAPSKAYFSPTLPTFPPIAQVPNSPIADPSTSSYFYPPGSPAGSTFGSNSPYFPSQEVASSKAFRSGGAPRARYASYPAGSAKADSAALAAVKASHDGGSLAPIRSLAPAPYSPLHPPQFRDAGGRSSPFASPVPSPPMGISPSASPPRSGSPVPSSLGMGSGRKLRSPPPGRVSDDSDDNEASQLWSPVTTDSNASTSSLLSLGSGGATNTSGAVRPYLSGRRSAGGSADSTSTASSSLLSSPESDLTSMTPDSPKLADGLLSDDKKQRPSNAMEFSHFLDRYRFHLNTSPSGLNAAATSLATSPLSTSSLGLSAPVSFVSSPTPASPSVDFFPFASSSDSASIPISISGGTSPSSAATSIAGSPTPPSRLSPFAHAVATSPMTGPPPATGTTIVS